ncbi:MAG: extracellular solute-binding protein [Nannocystaceae bacterium]|nr:extracellular solute-binding protein [Myxococcales bacterium]
MRQATGALPRALALALIALAALLLPSRAGAEEPVRLWHAYRGVELEVLEALAGEFAAEEGVVVDTLAVPYDAFAAKLSSAIPLGQGPDLFIDAHERLGDYRERGLVAPVGDAIEDPYAFTENARAAVRLVDADDGEALWAVPIAQKSLALYYNTDLVQGPPETLEAIADVAANLPQGTYALAYEARSAYGHAPLLTGFGGFLLADDGSFGFHGAPAVRSLELARWLASTGLVPEDADGALVTSLFSAGRAAYAISGPWLAADLEGDAGPRVPYAVAPLPKLAATGAPMRPLLTVEAVMLSPRGAARPIVRALARRLASAAAAERRQTIAHSLSARRDVPAPRGDAVLAAFAAQAELAIPMPTDPAMRATWEPAHRAIRKVLRGDATPTEATEAARRQFDDVRRPPPPATSPTPALLTLGVMLLAGALLLLRRARDPAARAALRRSLPAYAYVIHAVIAVGVLVIAPLLVGAATSLFAGRPDSGAYVGLGNFVEILSARGGPLLSSGSFYVVTLVTVLWTAVNVLLHLAIGISVGLLLARPATRLRGLYRVILILPWAVPSYVTALAWRGMFHRQFGAVTGLIEACNELLGTSIEPIAWFARFSTAFTANVATNVWLGFPFMMVVTMGALTSIPRDVLEAAEVDGAGRFARLRHVTLPMIRPSLVPAITLGAIWTFNMFNVVFLVSGGEPDGSTDILVSEAYRWAFTRGSQYGYAAAYAVLIFLLLSGVTRLTGFGRGEGGR